VKEKTSSIRECGVPFFARQRTTKTSGTFVWNSRRCIPYDQIHGHTANYTNATTSVTGEEHKDILELQTRIFLNAVDDFERPLRKTKDDQIKIEFDKKEAERKKKEEEYIKN
jgi:hypothetical protein